MRSTCTFTKQLAVVFNCLILKTSFILQQKVIKKQLMLRIIIKNLSENSLCYKHRSDSYEVTVMTCNL